MPWALRSVMPRLAAMSRSRAAGSRAMHTNTRAWLVRKLHVATLNTLPQFPEMLCLIFTANVGQAAGSGPAGGPAGNEGTTVNTPTGHAKPRGGAPRPGRARGGGGRPPRQGGEGREGGADWLRPGEALNELHRGLGDLAPAVVDCQRVPAARHLDDLGDARVRYGESR